MKGMRRRMQKVGLLVGMLALIFGAVMVIPARAANSTPGAPYIDPYSGARRAFWRDLYVGFNGNLYRACTNFSLAKPDGSGRHGGRVAFNQEPGWIGVGSQPVNGTTRVNVDVNGQDPLTAFCQFIELEYNQQQLDSLLKRVEGLAVGIDAGVNQLGTVAAGAKTAAEAAQTSADGAKTAADDAKSSSKLTGTKVDGVAKEVSTLSRKFSNLPRLTSEQIWERVVRREGVTQVTAWDEFVDLGNQVRALEQSSGAMSSGVDATRQALESVQETLAEVQSTLAGMSGGAGGGMTEAQGAQMLEALQAMSRGDGEDCPPREPGWWASIGISSGEDPCKRVDEGILKRAVDSVKEWMDQAEQARQAKADAVRAEGAGKAAAERAEDKAAAEAAEAEAQRKHDEMIRELRSVGRALGEKVDGVAEEVKGLGDRIDEAAERIAEAVKPKDPEPSEPGEFGPLDDLPGIEPGNGQGLMPNAQEWAKLSYCTLPVLEAGCDFPKIRIPAILGAKAWYWYPLGSCDDDLSYLHALRLVLGAVILVGAGALAARWIYAGLGVNAPSGEKG